MNQQQIRHFVERYLAAFSTHVMESHPDYLTVKLSVEVDKDIGNRPFYWSWVEKMNLPPKPLILTFFFDQEQAPEGMRGEHIHFGAGRLQQIFQSAQKHGRFVCMFEHPPLHAGRGAGQRRSVPLTPWLGVNLKVSFICDKKRDLLLYLGVNLHQSRIVHDFYPFLKRLSLSPSIPDYFYTLDRRLSLLQAFQLVEQETRAVLSKQDQRWADEARTRLNEELAILDAYYRELAMREEAKPEDNEEEDNDRGEQQIAAVDAGMKEASPVDDPPIVEASQSLDEYRSTGGRILDFLRMNTIPETPRAEINQGEWQKSTPEEEKERRMAELRWQHEPRIEVKLINGGLFYLHNMPPFPV
ncbi:YqhG family protein [Brevibacillus sp. H7]|uniref:YqhG family protein n=1 Tax=Brevibacillus sp. H7 TaxID=3349138 RepID=UPI003807CE60